MSQDNYESMKRFGYLQEEIRQARDTYRTIPRSPMNYIGELMMASARVFATAGFPIPHEYMERMQRHIRTNV